MTIQCLMTGLALAAYEVVTKKYAPNSCGRNHSQLGQAYNEAREFSRRDVEHILCPSDAICSVGPNSEPLGRSKEKSSES
mmetsp:Transcript_14090/g.25493  ORF Transcript_14090/g.25493 Transcript_14090/m.25493 type:complete len:80 (+) Transcript_14090:319-558(+)